MAQFVYSAPDEEYTKHIKKCLEKFDLVFPIFYQTICRVFELNSSSFDFLKEVLRQMIVFHDLGKLTKKWQERVNTHLKNPSHASIGAAYLYKKLKKENILEDLRNSIAFAVAIHHTDKGLLGDNIERPDVQAITDGIDWEKGIPTGKIIWDESVKNLGNSYFPKDVQNLTIEDLKDMARGLRIWARGDRILKQHKKRLQATFVHHLIKLCDISAATERKELKKDDDQDYYGGWLMVETIGKYVDAISKRMD